MRKQHFHSVSQVDFHFAMNVAVAPRDVAVVAMDVAVVALIIFQIAFAPPLGRNVGFVKRRVTCIACVKPYNALP